MDGLFLFVVSFVAVPLLIDEIKTAIQTATETALFYADALWAGLTPDEARQCLRACKLCAQELYGIAPSRVRSFGCRLSPTCLQIAPTFSEMPWFVMLLVAVFTVIMMVLCKRPMHNRA